MLRSHRELSRKIGVSMYRSAAAPRMQIRQSLPLRSYAATHFSFSPCLLSMLSAIQLFPGSGWRQLSPGKRPASGMHLSLTLPMPFFARIALARSH